MRRTKSAGAILVGPTGEIVVVSQHGTSWSLVKGTLEANEDLVTALRREVKEECGVSEFEVIKKMGTYERYMIGKDGGENKKEHKTITFYLCRTEQTELKPEDPENPEARWVSPGDVAGLLTHPKDKEFFAQHLPEVLRFINQGR